MKTAMLYCGLILMGTPMAWAGAPDDENELLAQLAVAQNDYDAAIDIMRDVGMDIAALESQLDGLFHAAKRAPTTEQQSSIIRQINQVRARLAGLQAEFDAAENDMHAALAAMETLNAALGRLGVTPDGTGGSGG